MSETKWTPGPWFVELISTWPFGIIVRSKDKEIVQQHAYCHSTEQETRKDCESGVGFSYTPRGGWTSRDEAAAFISEQAANARLVAAAPELYAALEYMAERFDRVDNGYCSLCGAHRLYRSGRDRKGKCRTKLASGCGNSTCKSHEIRAALAKSLGESTISNTAPAIGDASTTEE